MNFLSTILQEKKKEVAAKKRLIPLQLLIDRPAFRRAPLSLASALREDGINIIAEVKKASPSKGVIRENFDPVLIAAGYANGGAKAISVLTDVQFFQGALTHLETVREAVSLPILRKDFILDPYQLYESRAIGADAVLLIVAALERNQLRDLAGEAATIGLECLIEVHDERELESIQDLEAPLVGVNNRNLSTFDTDLNVSISLRRLVPPSTTMISESGITTASDIRNLMNHGIRGFLIGESLMRMPDPGRGLAKLLAEMHHEG